MDAKGPPGWACIAWEPRESIRSPARCVCARRGAGATKGAGARPSSAFSRGLGGAERSGAAQRSRSPPGRRRSADGANLPARPLPPEPGGCSGQRWWLESSARRLRSDRAGSADPGARGCPGLSELGGRGRGGSRPLPLGAPAHAAAAVSKCTGNGDLQPHTPPHPSRTRRGQKSGQGGDRREGWLRVPGSRRQELTCKQAVFLGSGLLDHDVDILLNSLLP